MSGSPGDHRGFPGRRAHGAETLDKSVLVVDNDKVLLRLPRSGDVLAGVCRANRRQPRRYSAFWPNGRRSDAAMVEAAKVGRAFANTEVHQRDKFPHPRKGPFDR